MPPEKASVAFSSRLPDDDPSQRYMDMFIALSVLEKLEVSYSKSLLPLEEYERELVAAIKQAHKAHRLIRHEFPTVGDFAKEFGACGSNVSGTHEFQRAIVQLEGGDDLIRLEVVGGRGGRVTNDAAKASSAVANITTLATKTTTTTKDFLYISDKIQEIKEVVEAYESEAYEIAVGRVRDLVATLTTRLARLDACALAIGGMQDCAGKIHAWRERLDGLESRALIDSQALVADVNSLKRALLEV